MKKLYLKEIHNILSLSKNKKGIKLDDLYKVYPYPVSFDLFKKIINEDELIKKLKDNIIIIILIYIILIWKTSLNLFTFQIFF